MVSDKISEKPFHESVVELMEMAKLPETMETVALLLAMTKIPDEHRERVMEVFKKRVAELGIQERIRKFLEDWKSKHLKTSESPGSSA